MDATSATTLWALVAYGLATVGVFVLALVLSRFLGPLKRDRSRQEEPYESGVLPTGTPQLRVNAQFYLFAVIFIVFDLETMFIIAWAVAFREAGIVGYVEILVFVAVFLITLLYLGRTGALTVTRRQDWRRYRDPAVEDRGVGDLGAAGDGAARGQAP